MATKMTIRFATEREKDYISKMIHWMNMDYEHGYLSRLEVDVSGDQGNCRIRKGRKKKGRRRIPKELDILKFMRRPAAEGADSAEKQKQDTGKQSDSLAIEAHENV